MASKVTPPSRSQNAYASRPSIAWGSGTGRRSATGSGYSSPTPAGWVGSGAACATGKRGKMGPKVAFSRESPARAPPAAREASTRRGNTLQVDPEARARRWAGVSRISRCWMLVCAFRSSLLCSVLQLHAAHAARGTCTPGQPPPSPVLPQGCARLCACHDSFRGL